MTYNAAPNVHHTGSEMLPDLGSPAELAEILGGVWTSLPALPLTAIRHRLDTIEEGLTGFLFAPELFARPKGTKARAALLAAYQALERGAAGLIVSERPRNIDPAVPCLLVDEPTKAIERLARHRRAHSPATFFAVTGSVGKTTNKNMIHAMASALAPAHKTIANYNDGLESIRFILSSLSDQHRYCAAEFSEVGDLEKQLEFYRPQVAVITNIYFEHASKIEKKGFRGEGVVRHLVELAAGVIRHLQPGGTCVLNADGENFALLEAEARKSRHARIMTCGTADTNHVRILSMSCDDEGSDIELGIADRRYTYRLSFPGRHMAENSVVAATAMHAAGIDLDKVLPVLESFKPQQRRGTIIQLPWKDGFITIRDESVSSSLPSLKSSLEQIKQERPAGNGRRIAVLGHVGELGVTTRESLTEMAAMAEAGPTDRFYTIGIDTRIFNEAIRDRSRVAPHFQTLEQLEHALRQELIPGDRVVFKGTRRPANIALRKLVDRLVASSDPSTSESLPSARLVIGGDTYFGEYYQAKRASEAELNYLDAFGYDYSAERLSPLFRRADFSVLNLECALTNRTSSGLSGRKSYILGGKPRETIAALKNLNIGGVLLGNNHAMDYEAAGLEDTLNSLSGEGILISGAGRNKMDAQRPILVTFDVDGISFKTAILSGYEYNDSHEEMRFYAGSERPGVNNIHMGRMREQIAALKSAGYFTIVSPHWGSNYCFRSYSQSTMASRLIDCGADLILGHGPHMLNEIRQVDGVWVIYSLGNLIFNSEGEYERHHLQPYSLVAELELARTGVGVTGMLNLYPIVSCNQMTQFQPTFVDDRQFQHVMNLLTGTHYDPSELASSLRTGTKDGRHCLTVQLF